MSNHVRRVFVEKKAGFDIEAGEMLKDIRENLEIKSVSDIRIIHCYDTEGLGENLFNACCQNIFAEPNVDNILFRLDIKADDFVFGKRLLPGQYDQRADSAAQCIQITCGSLPLVQYTKFHIITGNITDAEKQAILKYGVNPVDSMEVGMDMPKTLSMTLTEPKNIENINIIHKNNEEITQIHKDLSLAMSLDDLLFIRDYFKNEERREPTATEIKVIDTYWSDHCRHTTFHTELTDIAFEEGPYKQVFEKSYKEYLDVRNAVYGTKQRPVTLMDMATIGMKYLRKNGLLNDLDDSEEVNAASIVINVDIEDNSGKHEEEWLLMFKNETHNHPTEMEPFGGAATCLGGAIRDPLSGRSYVYQAMRVTGSGDPTAAISDTLPGKLPQRVITTEAARGYSSYGNQIGLATGLVNEIYHEGYVAKHMEIGAVIGAAKRENVIRNRPSPGDIVILTGGRTGRDGIGGATGSSKEHGENSLATAGAEVQKGNPVTEHKLQRLFRNPEAAKLIIRCNDFGAGGVSVAIGELADSIEINLDNILKKYDGLDGTELAISESQERMAVVVRPEDAKRFIGYAHSENLEAYQVAVITDSGRLVMKWRDTGIVNISRAFLDTSGIRQKASVEISSPKKQFSTPHSSFLIDKASWLNNLSDLNVASQKGLSEMFDSTVGAGTVLAPFGGKYQLTPIETMAAKIPVLCGKTNTTSLMSYGFNPYISESSPYHGAVYAVCESVSRLVAAGADFNKIRLSFQEYFERLGGAKSWGKPAAALLGALKTQLELGIPAIGGKDSMSGSFLDMHVPPTLVSFAVCTADSKNIISPEFKSAGNVIAILKTPSDKNNLPDFDALKQNYRSINLLIKNNMVISAYTIGFGGIAAALSKMCFGNKIGADINYDGNFFSPQTGWFLLEIKAEAISNIDNLEIIGKTTNKGLIVVNDIEISLDECIEAWMSPLEKVFPTGALKDQNPEKPELPKPRRTSPWMQSPAIAANKTPKPKVLIPVFPGTNCEWDMYRKFEEAGANADMFVINNLSSRDLLESVSELAKRIRNSQIIAVPGGFSAGDEPEGSGKFIANIFKNETVSEAVADLLNKREGLILGICNGFQALIKLGLVPYGLIRQIDESCPTLTYNTIGRHVSSLVTTKIVSNKSPWLRFVNEGDTHKIAASHGQGRFVADETLIQNLAENGQIAAVYVDISGKPTTQSPYNPNGSMYGIEAITSPDGRILGKMCHSERINGLYKNVPGDYDQRIFEAGVEYFK